MQIKTIVFAIAVTSVMAACTRVKSSADLVGAFRADYKLAKENLTLRPDGSFEQEVVLKSTGRSDTGRGTWKYDPHSGYIDFDGDFMLVMDGFHNLNPDYAKPKAGGVSYPVELFFGKISIGSSEGVVYTKN